MLWKVVIEGAVQRCLLGLKNAPTALSRSWESRAANRAKAVTPRQPASRAATATVSTVLSG